MSEEATNETTPGQQAAEQVVEPVDQLGEGGKRAIQSEREARRKAEDAAKALQAKLDEIEQANMSELERAKKQAETAEAELNALRLDSLRKQVALEKGLPAALLDRLRGESAEDIAADADALMALVNAPRSPMPDPSQGSRGEAAPTTPEQAFVAFANTL